MTSVLIVEDEKPISDLIRGTLSTYGYSCDCAYDGREAADKLERKNYSLILLDLMLPEISGYDLLDYIRAVGTTPVIILSAMVDVEDRIRGLRMGADDYLCKPFQIGELIARVESVLRRSVTPVDMLTVGDITISFASRQVWKGGEPVDLTMKEFDLLAELVRHKNVALSRSRLYEVVWQEDYTGETRTLDSHIQRLRKKLNLERQLKTVYRVGYRLEVRE